MTSSIWSAMAEEVACMRSGRFIPYHKMAMMIAIVTCIVFSVVFSHGVVFNGRIAVIDLDHTRCSASLIEKINSSSYIEVQEVYHAPLDPVLLTASDRNLGVLYIPKGLEKRLNSGRDAFSLGYLADYTNEAQNAEVIENLNEIVATLGGQQAALRISPLGLTRQQSENTLNPLSVKIRRLFDPVFSATNATVIYFILFFSSIYIGLTTLMIMGRLQVTGQRARALAQGPLCLIARLCPYALFYTTAITVVSALLITFGQLRFAGSYVAFLPTIFLTGMCIGMFGMVLSWHASDPGHGAAFMILIVPPGFITGGSTMAVGFLPDWAYQLSHAFPLVWLFSFFRDFAQRGAPLAGMLGEYGKFLIYFSILGLLITYRWYRSQSEFQGAQPLPPGALEREPSHGELAVQQDLA